MNPHQKNKIDINKLSGDEQRLFRLYGKLPNKKDLLQNKLKERKYFDSGDYALSKAGKASDTGVTTIGTEHPQADNIPHMSPLTHTISRSDSIAPGTPGAGSLGASPENTNPLSPGATPGGIHRGSINGIPGGGMPGMQHQQSITSRSPIKESSFLARHASMDEGAEAGEQGQGATLDGSVSPPGQKVGIPIRR